MQSNNSMSMRTDKQLHRSVQQPLGGVGVGISDRLVSLSQQKEDSLNYISPPRHSSAEPRVVDDSWPQMQHLVDDLLENMPGPRISRTQSNSVTKLKKFRRMLSVHSSVNYQMVG